MFIFGEGLTFVPVQKTRVATAMTDVMVTLARPSKSDVDEDDDKYKDDVILEQIHNCRFAKIRKVLEGDSNSWMVTRRPKTYKLVDSIEGEE